MFLNIVFWTILVSCLIHDPQNWIEFLTTSFGRNASLFGNRLEEWCILLVVLEPGLEKRHRRLSRCLLIAFFLIFACPFFLLKLLVLFPMTYSASCQIFLLAPFLFFCERITTWWWCFINPNFLNVFFFSLYVFIRYGEWGKLCTLFPRA